MDNLTHTLFAATLARTPLGRAGRGATAALVLASSAPDVDIVAIADGTASYLQWHRGPTHGPLGIVALGIVTAGLVWGGSRLFDRRRAATHAPFRVLARVSIVGVIFHVLMDLPTSYGSRLLSPFDWHWYAVDVLPIIDIYLLTILLAGLVFGSVAARKAALKRPPYLRRANPSGPRWDDTRSAGLSGPRPRWGAPQRYAAIALTLMAVNYGARAAAHHRALTLAPRVFGPLMPDRCEARMLERSFIDRWPRSDPSLVAGSPRPCLVEIAAIPTFASPFEWRLIAHLSNAYEIRDLDLLDVRLRRAPGESEAMWHLARRYTNHWTPAVNKAAATPAAQAFLGFSRFPAARALVDRDGVATIDWSDMRFTAAIPSRDTPRERGNLFALTVRVGPDGRILEERIGP